jgi:hypothetical protein
MDSRTSGLESRMVSGASPDNAGAGVSDIGYLSLVPR